MLLGSAVLLPSAACGGDDYRIHDDDDGTATTNAGGSAGSSSTSSAGGSAACAATSGSYLFALSLSLLPSAPILFDSQVTVTDSSNGGQLTMTLQPIDRCDRATLVGSPTVVGPVPLDGDGSFSTTIDSVTVPEEANPLTGTDLVAVIELSGNIGELSVRALLKPSRRCLRRS
jgi:hypothetical protein